MSQDSANGNLDTLPQLMHPENYGFSYDLGSLFKDEPIPFLPWLEEARRFIPELFGTVELFQRIEALPEPSVVVLRGLTKKQQHRAMKRYNFLASAYLKNHRSGVALRPDLRALPANIARPSVFLAKRLGIPPILSYSHYCQCNWEMIDPNGPFRISNLRLEQPFINPQAIPDESGFILVHAVIEEHGRLIPFAISRAKQAVTQNDPLYIETSLMIIAGCLKQMYAEMLKMPRWCSSEKYWFEVRPQIQQFRDVIFEGVDDPDFQKPITLRGETGAQTPLINLLFAFFDVPQTESPLTQHTRDMRNYILPDQRRFIELAESMPSIRKYIEISWRQYPEIRLAYNNCLDNLYMFLRKHYEYAITYIHRKSGGHEGTGGTPFKEWLRLHLLEMQLGKIYIGPFEAAFDKIRLQKELARDPIFGE